MGGWNMMNNMGESLAGRPTTNIYAQQQAAQQQQYAQQQQQAQAQAQWTAVDETGQWFLWAPTNQYWDSWNQLYYDPASQMYYDAQNNTFTAEQVAARAQQANLNL